MMTVRILAWVGAAFAAQALFAAVPVIESQGSQSQGAARSPGTVAPREYPAESHPAAQTYPTSTPDADEATVAQSYPSSATVEASAGPMSASSELFVRFQMLQTEVQELRGLVEEQRHQIERLEREQKEQYLDLDRRVAMLRPGSNGASAGGRGATAGASVPSTDGGVASLPSSSTTAGPLSSAGNSVASERDAYGLAFNYTRDKRFQQAIDAFNQMLVDYPNGEYSGNAFYWLGELYLALPEPQLEKSRQSFTQIVNLYPNHAKVPDSLYKLGVVFHRLGDSAKAIDYLDQAQRRFPATPAARLAQSYEAEIRPSSP